MSVLDRWREHRDREWWDRFNREHRWDELGSFRRGAWAYGWPIGIPVHVGGLPMTDPRELDDADIVPDTTDPLPPEEPVKTDAVPEETE